MPDTILENGAEGNSRTDYSRDTLSLSCRFPSGSPLYYVLDLPFLQAYIDCLGCGLPVAYTSPIILPKYVGAVEMSITQNSSLLGDQCNAHGAPSAHTISTGRPLSDHFA